MLPCSSFYRYRFAALIALIASLTACTQDPNVLKRRYLEHGDRYYRIGKFPQAVIMYRTALKKDILYGDAFLHMARAYARMGEISETAPALERAHELLPEGEGKQESRIALADIDLAYLERRGYEKFPMAEAGRLADELLHIDPKSYDGLRIQGKLASLDAAYKAGPLPEAANKRLKDAITSLKAAEAIRPYQLAILVPLGRSLWAAGSGDEAETVWLKAAAHYKSQITHYSEGFYLEMATAYAELYRFYLMTNRKEKAEEILRRAIDDSAHHPQESKFLISLAELLQGMGRRQEMATALERLKASATHSQASYAVAGNLYLKSEDYDQAIREYGQGIAAYPQDKLAFDTLIVEALVKANRIPEATAMNDAVLKDHPKDPTALTRRSGFLLERGGVDKAVAELAALSQQNSSNAFIHYQYGRALVAAGHAEQGLVQFQEAVRFDRKFAPGWLSLAQLQHAAGEYGNAVISAEYSLDLDPKSAPAMLIRAMALHDMKKTEDARRAFEDLLKRFPTYSDALFQFGVMYAQENRPQEAQALYKRSFAANPNNAAGLSAIVRALLAKDQADAAIRLIKDEIAKYPGRVDVEAILADTQMRTGHPDLAIAGYQALLKKAENDPKSSGTIRFRLAVCYRRQGDSKAALAELEKARQLLPNSAPVLHNLGVLLDSMGRRAEAKALYEAALRIDGEDADILNNLAFYMAQNGGDLDQALTYAQRARQKSPRDVTFADTVGFIYLKKHLVDNALDVLQTVVEKEPQQAVFRLHLGEALLQKGETARGRQQLETALANKPSPEDAAAIRQLLSRIGA